MPRRKKDEEKDKFSTLLSTGEVAAIFEVHPNTVRRWSEEGKLTAEKIGPRGDRMFRREDVAAYYLDRAIKMYLKGKSS
ncbi:MAG TPA: helix-turn-helix domain-containing protein [Dehalococcoidia bacterium]|nr:helix-turn-helix domain-containing protein [Dehalococcoidia bacterium]